MIVKRLMLLCGLVLCLSCGAGLAEDRPEPISLPNALSAYQGILQDGDSFLFWGDGRPSNLARLAETLEDFPLAFPRFALADLDQDGIPELILEEVPEGSEYAWAFVVFHIQDGTVYGYEMVYRALLELKEDGTFSYSSGAADNGYGYAAFTSERMEIVPLAFSQSGRDAQGNDTVSYFIENQPISPHSYNQALTAQEKKANAEWHNLTDANIQALLAAQ